MLRLATFFEDDEAASYTSASSSGSGLRSKSTSSASEVPASTSRSRMRADAAEANLAAAYAEIARLKLTAGVSAGSPVAPATPAPAASSSATRHRVRELEERLRLAKAREDRASIDKLKDVQSLIVRSYQLDLAFLVDVTGSMDSSIQMVRDKIKYVSERVRAVHPRTALRVAFVGYRDYGEATDVKPFVDLSLGQPGRPAADAPGGLAGFVEFVAGVRASGGGDTAEDVFCGLERVASLDWRAQGSRLLVHIADAPCHGRDFHDATVMDNHASGDKLGRSIHTILDTLKSRTNIQTYFFAHLNTSTHQMINKFKSIANTPQQAVQWLQDVQVTNLEQLPEKIIIMSVQSISTAVAAAGLGVAAGVIPIPVVKTKPIWETVPEVPAVALRAVLEDAEDFVEMIRNKEPIEWEEFARMDIKIAPSPFSNDGASRWPYYARVTRDDTRSKVSDFVVKRFKVPVGANVASAHRKSKYEVLVELQAVCAAMAKEFNNVVRDEGVPAKRISFSQVSLLEAKGMYYCMEKELLGDFIKYNNNAGYVRAADYADTLQAFSHWTWDFSGGALMVTDLQGVLSRDQDKFWLCDPAIHTTDGLRFGSMDLGEEGYKVFFESHRCNGICRGLRLKRHPSQRS